MKFISINRLCDFEFHDAEFTLLSVDKDLSVKAEFLNIHKDAEQNPHKTDMEIEAAEIIFPGKHRRKTYVSSENTEDPAARHHQVRYSGIHPHRVRGYAVPLRIQPSRKIRPPESGKQI